MTVLGLDLALACSGWAMVSGDGERLLAAGQFRTPDRRPGEADADWQVRRAASLAASLRALLATPIPGEPPCSLLAWEVPSSLGGRRWYVTTWGRDARAQRALGVAEGYLAMWLALAAPGLRPLALPVHEARRLFGVEGGGKAAVARAVRLRFGVAVGEHAADAAVVAAVAADLARTSGVELRTTDLPVTPDPGLPRRRRQP
jgi:hypothetical protein